MENFDQLFDDSNSSEILAMAKTLSKEECRQIYYYMGKRKPKKILEFGVQYGCSTAVFLKISEWLGLDIELHSWDILDLVKKKCVNKKDFHFHVDDITGREDKVMSEYNPDLIFLDAHPYHLTKRLMEYCINNKVDFMCHDVSDDIFERAKKRSKGFTDFSSSTMAEWESYLLAKLIDPSILKNDFFENEICTVSCYRDRFGLAVTEFKNK